MSGTPGRGRRHGDAVRSLKAQARAAQAPCWICSQPIRYDLAWPDRDSFSLDHVKPLRTHPHLANDPANHRPAHLGCNSAKQDGAVDHFQLGTPTRHWGPR